MYLDIQCTQPCKRRQTLQDPKSSFHVIADGVASLICVKQQAYGDSFTKAEQILDILYPDGIPIKSYGDALAIVRILDKLSRIATNDDPLNEDPWMDIAGYALLSLAKRKEEPENNEYPKRVDFGDTAAFDTGD